MKSVGLRALVLSGLFVSLLVPWDVVRAEGEPPASPTETAPASVSATPTAEPTPVATPSPEAQSPSPDVLATAVPTDTPETSSAPVTPETQPVDNLASAGPGPQTPAETATSPDDSPGSPDVASPPLESSEPTVGGASGASELAPLDTAPLQDGADDSEAEPSSSSGEVLAIESAVPQPEIPDPYFFVGGVKYSYLPSDGDCAGATNCVVSNTPIQDAINAVAGGLAPDDGAIYVESGAFAEDILIENLSGLSLLGVDPAAPPVLQGAVAIVDSANITLQNFVYAQTITVENSSGVTISGTAGDDQITVAAVGGSQVAVEAEEGDDEIDLQQSEEAVAVDGGPGVDTLIGPLLDAAWEVSAPGAGDLNGGAFRDVENLHGAADNRDTFIIHPAAEIALLDGGAGGFDVVSLDGGAFQQVIFDVSGPDSGAIHYDGKSLVYRGMEPVACSTCNGDVVFNGTGEADQVTLKRDSAGHLVIESDNALATFESHIIAEPITSLTINLGGNADVTDEHVYVDTLGVLDADLTINGDGGPDKVVFRGNLYLPGHNLRVVAETVEVQSGVTISTRQIANPDSGNHETASSSGNSGNI